MLRVKDGILFVEKWLARMDALVDEIVVVDNGSTDGTYEIFRSHPKVAALERTAGYHEGRDKILAYQLARVRGAEWVLWLDVDEIFEDRLTRDILDRMMASKRIVKYAFRKINFHKDYQHFEARLDKLWEMASPDRHMWKDQPAGYFADLQIHNGPICGIVRPTAVSSIRIKHIGSVDRTYLQRKTDIYLSVDPAHSEMYVRNRDQAVAVWRWYEYHERPVLVTAQNALLGAMYRLQWARAMGRAAGRKLTSFFSPKAL